MKKSRYNTFRFLRDNPAFVDQSVQSGYHSTEKSREQSDEKQGSLTNLRQNASSSQNVQSRERLKDVISQPSEYFDSTRLQKLTPVSKTTLIKSRVYSESPVVSQLKAERMMIPNNETKNNILLQYHEVIHRSIQPEIKASIQEAEQRILQTQVGRDNFYETLELFFQGDGKIVPGWMNMFMEKMIEEFEATLEIREYTQQVEKEGGFTFETYHSQNRQRQIAMQLAMWVHQQLFNLRFNKPHYKVNELFQKLHVIVAATQIELSRQVGVQMKEWALLIQQLFQIQIKTYLQGNKLVRANVEQSQQQEMIRLDKLHKTYQASLDSMLLRESKCLADVVDLKEGIEICYIPQANAKYFIMNQYLRKKCLKVQHTNNVLMYEKDTLKDELQKTLKQIQHYKVALQEINQALEEAVQREEQMRARASLLSLGDEEAATPTPRRTESKKFSFVERLSQQNSFQAQLPSQSEVSDSPKPKKQLPERVLLRLANFLQGTIKKASELNEPTSPTWKELVKMDSSKVLPSPKKSKFAMEASFRVDEHMEQELFIQNNHDFDARFTGEVAHKCLETSISLTYGIDVGVQVGKDLMERSNAIKMVQAVAHMEDRSTQCYPDLVQRQQLQGQRAPAEPKSRLIVPMITKEEDPEVVKLRKEKRKALLENAPKIIIFEVENKFETVGQVLRLEALDNLQLLAQVKDKVNQLQSDVQKFNTLRIEEKTSLKTQLTALHQIITQVSNNITNERMTQHRKTNSLMIQIAEKDNEKVQLEYQLDSLQRLAARLQNQLQVSQQTNSQHSESDSLPSTPQSQTILQQEELEADENVTENGQSEPPQSSQSKLRSIVQHIIHKQRSTLRQRQDNKLSSSYQNLQISIEKQEKLPRLITHNLSEKTLTYNLINQTMLYLHFYSPQTNLGLHKHFENRETILKSLFKKLRDVFRTKKGITSTFDEFTYHHFQEILGKSKMAEQKFVSFLQFLMNFQDPDPQVQIFLMLISGQYSSLSNRIQIYFLSSKFAILMLQQNDISDLDLGVHFTQFLRESFALNYIQLQDQVLQLCLQHFLPEARKQLNNKITRLKKSSSGEISGFKRRRTTMRLPSPQAQEQLNAISMRITDQNVSGQQEMVQLLMDHCFQSLYAQDYIFRQLIALISSDILLNSVSLDEFSFILGGIVTEQSLQRSCFKKFNQLCLKDQSKRQRQLQSSSRISYQDFHSILGELNLLKRIEECVKTPAKFTVSVIDVIFTDQIGVKEHLVSNSSQLLYHWSELQLQLKTRLWMTKSFHGVPSKVINQLDLFISGTFYQIHRVINNKADPSWDHGFMNESSLVWLFQLLIHFSNNTLFESQIDQCIPQAFQDIQQHNV